MTIKSRLNTIALLSVGAFAVLFGFLFYTTLQIESQLDQIDRVNRFSKTASELNIITEQYLAYGEPRYRETWHALYEKLENTKENIEKFPTRDVVSNSLPSIREAFMLIQKVRDNPQLYQNRKKRERLLERATARIRSDLQLLMSVSHSLEDRRRQAIRNIQVDQRINILLFLVLAISLITYLIFRSRKRILNSLQQLIEGTQEVAEGNLDKHIDITGFGEHQRLAESFNEMTKKIRTHVEREQKLRSEAEQNLKRWEKLVEQDPSMILIHVQGEVKFINAGGVEIFGAETGDELIGSMIYSYIDEAQMSKAIKRIQQLEDKRRKVSPTIYRVKRLDGEERYLQIQSVPIIYEGQRATQTVGVDVTEHITYEEELQESLEEKSVLLQEIHHRVKNNLAVISGMLQLQSVECDNEMLTSKLNDSQLRIQSMALIHELLYESESFSELHFADNIQQLVETIKETLQPGATVDINYLLEDVVLNVNQALPCALIVNELVTNAFNHAFKGREKGTLDIQLANKEGVLELTVRDNGVGLPDNFQIKDANTLGLRIIETLVRQLNADIDYESKKGTEFRVSFKIADVKGVGSAHL